MNSISNQLTIVFATNAGFCNYTYVSIFSLLAVTHNANLDINILVSDLPDKSVQMLESLSCEKARIHCVHLNDFVKDDDLRGLKHLSKAALYRLYIPIVFPEAKRVLYIDSDTIIRHDISELYNSELKDCPLGVVREYELDFMNAHGVEIGMKDPHHMFNSGLLVMDCEKFEQMQVRERCLKLLEADYLSDNRKYIFLDQDLLNCVLEGKVHYLEDKWNVQVQYYNRQYLFKKNARKEYEHLCHNAWIVHFAGTFKPWNSNGIPFEEVFWDEVKKTEYGFDIIENALKESIERNEIKCFEHYRFPYEQIAAGEKIALYGAGGVGKAFERQLYYTQYAKVVLWVDKSYQEIGLPNVKSVESIKESIPEIDHIVIAIEKESIAITVRQYLESQGIYSAKIVWTTYNQRSEKCENIS